MKEAVIQKKKSTEKNITSEQIIDFLEKTSLLQKVPLDNIKAIISSCKIVHCKKGSVVFKTGDSAKLMYFIYTGNIAEFVGYGSSVDVIVKLRRRFDYIGEMGILIDEAYPNTAVALTNLTLVALPKDCFLNFAWSNPTITQYIIRELIDRLTNSCKKMINAMYLDAPGKLAFTLVTFTNNIEIEADTNISVTQHDLAASAGIARQTAAKILADWRRENWISTVRGKIRINDIDALLEIILNSELK